MQCIKAARQQSARRCTHTLTCAHKKPTTAPAFGIVANTSPPHGANVNKLGYSPVPLCCFTHSDITRRLSRFGFSNVCTDWAIVSWRTSATRLSGQRAVHERRARHECVCVCVCECRRRCCPFEHLWMLFTLLTSAFQRWRYCGYRRRECELKNVANHSTRSSERVLIKTDIPQSIYITQLMYTFFAYNKCAHKLRIHPPPLHPPAVWGVRMLSHLSSGYVHLFHAHDICDCGIQPPPPTHTPATRKHTAHCVCRRGAASPCGRCCWDDAVASAPPPPPPPTRTKC